MMEWKAEEEKKKKNIELLDNDGCRPMTLSPLVCELFIVIS